MKTIMRLAIAFSAVVLTLGAQEVMATIYAVGTCVPSLKSFVHIQDALKATPPPTTDPPTVRLETQAYVRC